MYDRRFLPKHKYPISSDFTNIQWKMSLARGIRLLQLSKPPVRHANFTLHGAGTKRWYGSRHEMPFVLVQPQPFFGAIDEYTTKSLVPILMRKFIFATVGTYMIGRWGISRYSPETAIGMDEVTAWAFRRWFCGCDTSSAVGPKEER